jgi:negative regulator of flagellin synthesis FlgM
MTIGRIDAPEPIQHSKKPGQNNRIDQTAKADYISLSSEDREMGELYQAVELVSSAPDVRADRIEELKQKINDPSYITETLISATADKIMDVFGL